jgi:hypothetical protein
VKLRYALITVALVYNRLVIESRESDRDGRENDGAVLVGTLNLVDLAGSESVRNTGATGMRAKEGGNINKSLLALSMVINKLSTQSQHVSYRDSKLTHLLSPSLSGNAKMAIICCITPASNYQDETRSTLQFASGQDERHRERGPGRGDADQAPQARGGDAARCHVRRSRDEV